MVNIYKVASSKTNWPHFFAYILRQVASIKIGIFDKVNYIVNTGIIERTVQ